MNSPLRTHYNELDNSFVGIRKEDNTINVYFPRGIVEVDSHEFKKNVFSLVRILKNKHLRANLQRTNTGEDSFPFDSYIFLIQDFLKNGYFESIKVSKHIDGRGKILWKDTIKKIKPIFNDEGAIFSKFVIRKKYNSQETLIATIYKQCLKLSLDLIGWLFGYISSEPPQFIVGKNEAIAIIANELSSSFSDKNKELFSHLLKILKSSASSFEKSDKLLFGVGDFAPIWEYLIDRKFGDKNIQRNYHPRAKWHLKDNPKHLEFTPLRLDSIHIVDNSAYVLDSKYYKYGITFNPNDLPATESVAKQIIYGEYVKKEGKFSEVYNAFIIPANNVDVPYKYLGYATSNWKSEKGEHHERIILISVDMQFLLRTYDNNSLEEKESFMELIRTSAQSI